MLGKYGYGWVTLGFFLFSLIGHYLLGFGNGKGFWEITEATLENWQSEFLQLLWQIGGLSFLLYVGSPQSKNESDRVESKLDWMMTEIGQMSHALRVGTDPGAGLYAINKINMELDKK